jgi:SepF-like predicted cell division protein (DUF552 family)
MKETFLNIKNKLSKSFGSKEAPATEEEREEYVTVGSEAAERSKVVVKTYVMDDFSDIKPVLDDLREGYTIALINIKPLKDKDLVELKRAVNKLKKTTDAIEGDIAGFGEDYIVVAPSFASIERTAQTSKITTEEEPAE